MVEVAESIPSSLDAAKELISHEEDGTRESAAKAIGYVCRPIQPFALGVLDREAHDVRMYGPVQYPRLVRGGCPNRHNGDARDCGQRAAASVGAHCLSRCRYIR